MGIYYARIMTTPEGLLMVAIADEEVIDKAVRDEERGLQIIVSREFYGERIIDELEAIRLIEEADVLVLAGDRIVSKAVELGYVHPDSILEVKGVKHVQVFKFMY